MNEQMNGKWLDELISKVINTEKPQFDAEKWKQKYSREFQALLSRAVNGSFIHRPNIWQTILRNHVTKLAVAAVIIIAISFFFVQREPLEHKRPQEVIITKSPAEMLTIMSLNIAYRRGGIEALERQCEQAIEKLGPRPAKVTVEELLADFNGS